MNAADYDAIGNAPATPRGREANERTGGMRALGVASSRLATPIIARRGGGLLSRLKAEWSIILGPEWSTHAWPAALGRDGALKLRVAPAHALQLQHRAPLLLERINLFYGRQIVTRIALVQAPPPLEPLPKLRPVAQLPQVETARLERRLGSVDDPDLRDALGRLGRAVLASETDPP